MADQKEMKILLIDDEILFCQTFKDIFTPEGYEVIFVQQGEKALNILATQGIQVAIIDINLPDISGLEILKFIKSSDLETCAIMLTGYATLENSIKALNEGAYAYITKPYQIDEVKATIRNAFEKQRLCAENQRLLRTLQLNNQQLTKANEQLKELDRMKSEFLAMVSHELKTPLTAIIGYSHHLSNQSSEPEFADIQDGLQRITRNGYLLLDLINKLLEFSRIESGNLSVILEEFDLREILEEALLISMPMARDKNIRFVFHPDEFHLMIEADRQKLKEIFLNLLSNAVKFTEKPNSSVSIQVDNNGDSVLISVADEGIGIRPEDQEIIFEKFRQLDSSLSRKIGGVGLGLSIVKKFVDIHKGKVWVESAPDKGSNFMIEIPKKQKKDWFIVNDQPTINN